jgi:hypothetical protein
VETHPESMKMGGGGSWSPTHSITLFTGILFGLAPALTAARADVSRGLKDSGELDSCAARCGRGADGGIEARIMGCLLAWKSRSWISM